MKIKVQIDSVFQEEMLQIQAPSRTPKIQQVVEFVESLDDNQRLKGKKDGETYFIESNAISRIYIENRQVLAETIQGEYHLGLRLYQVLEKLPSKSHNQRLSTSKKLNASTLPLTASLKFTLKTRKPPTHHAVTSKQ